MLFEEPYAPSVLLPLLGPLDVPYTPGAAPLVMPRTAVLDVDVPSTPIPLLDEPFTPVLCVLVVASLPSTPAFPVVLVLAVVP